MLLIVDDDRDLRDSLVDFLTIAGYEVYSAGNGKEALEWFKDRTTYPGLIFLDIVMPVLDGWGFLGKRRGDPLINLIPIVIMSGSLGIADRAVAAGAVHVLQKPFGGKEMLPIIERFIRRAATA
jgi:DNA-binding response OmpR family regulator